MATSTQSSKASAHGGRSGLSKSPSMASGLKFSSAFLTLPGSLEFRFLVGSPYLLMMVSMGRTLLDAGEVAGEICLLQELGTGGLVGEISFLRGVRVIEILLRTGPDNV